jgi:geranylgeranyl pyrophosphate synthase
MTITACEALEGWKLVADDLIDESALEAIKWSVFLSWISNVAVVDLRLVQSQSNVQITHQILHIHATCSPSPIP